MNKLVEIRLGKGLTQKQLSEASGVPLRVVRSYEQETRDILKAQIGTLIALSEALGCDLKDLL